MRFNELAQNELDDDFNKWDEDDTCRPKLMLKHLNKMRNRREMTLKYADKIEDVPLQYGADPEAQ